MLIVLVNKFVLFAFFIENIGIEKYGEWIFIFSFATIFSIFNFGWNKSVINSQILNFKKYSDSLSYFYSNLIFIFLVIFLVFLGSLIYIQIFNFENKIIYAVLIFYFLFLIPGRVIIAQYTVLHKFYKTRLLLNVEEIFQLILLFLCLSITDELLYLTFCYLIPSLIIVFWVIYEISSKNYNTKLEFKKKYIISNLKISYGFFSLNLVENFTAQGPILIIGKFLNKALIPIFVAHKTISNTIKTIFHLFNSVISPEFSHSFKNNSSNEDFNKLFSLFYSAVIVFGFILVLILNVIGKNFMEVWLGGSVQYNHYLLQLLLLALFINLLKSVPLMVLNSLNINKEYAIIDIIILLFFTIIIFFMSSDLSLELISKILVFYESILFLVVISVVYSKRLIIGPLLNYNFFVQTAIMSLIILILFNFFPVIIASIASIIFLIIAFAYFNFKHFSFFK